MKVTNKHYCECNTLCLDPKEKNPQQHSLTRRRMKKEDLNMINTLYDIARIAIKIKDL